jgi:hypothetical protein
MPHRRSASSKIRPAGRRGISRRRYDDAEKRRAALLDHMSRLGEKARTHPSYKSAVILLNQRFRIARIDQRIAILKAASWLINLIEMDSGMLLRRRFRNR